MGMKYFAYGSNMDPERMRSRGIRFSKRVHAVLRGYILRFNKVSSRNPREGYANIVPHKGGIVEGIRYEIPDEDIYKLDKFEGYPYHYNRIEVDVELDDGRRVRAVTYIAQPDKVREGLKPSRGYLKHLLAGKDILSESYYEMLKSWPTLD